MPKVLFIFYIFGASYHNKAICRRRNVYESRFGGIFLKKIDIKKGVNADRINETKKHWIGVNQSYLGQKRDTDL